MDDQADLTTRKAASVSRMGLLDRKVGNALTRVESSGFVRLGAVIAAIAGFAVLIATAAQIRADFEDRAEEREYRRLDRIEAARDRLLSRAGGNTGKGDAFRFLMSEGVDVTGMDLSCPAIGGLSTQGSCFNPPIFDNLVFEGRLVQSVQFNETIILSLRIADAELRDFSFDSSGIRFVEIVKADVIASTFRDAVISGCRIYKSRVRFGDARDISRCDVSDSMILDLEGLGDGDHRFGLVSWADLPPL